MRPLPFVAALLILVGAGCSSETLAPASEPEVDDAPFAWTELGIDAASALAMAEGKSVLVCAYTSWCGYCRRMDQKTWLHAELGGWLKNNVIAVHWNLEDPDQGKLHQLFTVTAVPTVILARDMNEVARHVGYIDPEALLPWLKAQSAPGEGD